MWGRGQKKLLEGEQQDVKSIIVSCSRNDLQADSGSRNLMGGNDDKEVWT